MTAAPRPAVRLLLALLVPAAVSCSANVETGGGSTAAAADTVATVEHGKYRATILGCHYCYTPG